MTLTLDTLNTLNGGRSGTAVAAAGGQGTADTFLKLLVTQMQNQDPLNPMDNAQVTSQIAQINTVTGIESLNTTVAGLGAQFTQLQALQGVSLVGRDVTLEGNALQVADGQGAGAFTLAGTADAVKVEVLNGAGRVVDTLQLGALGSGQHAFRWDAGKNADGAYTFRVGASAGAAAVAATPLVVDRVLAVSLSGGKLMLDTLRSGAVEYAAVRSVN
ncbi:MAG: flagellar hook assembly protein FlgD [Comamonadaceae bacterium]|nr:flagellar hook assembly protein FlgD [Comamonadaceae bacterium]